MSVIESPNDPRILLEVDPSFGAARFSVRPIEYRTKDGSLVGGHYRTSFSTGLTTGIAAAGALASMRWTSDNLLFVLGRLRAFAVISTAFTTGQETSVDLVKMNGFTAADSGGTDLLPAIAAGAGRKRGTMQPSRIQDLRVAGAAALGAGTGTPDGAACGAAVLNTGNVVGAAAAEELMHIGAMAEHPLTLAKNEGFRIRNLFAQGAVGVVRFTFVMDWAEVPVY
jgi:hypothetical protein